MNNTYRIFINGAFFNGSDIYEYAMNRALSLAMYHKLDFVNTKSKLIIDKWTNDKMAVIITKN